MQQLGTEQLSKLKALERTKELESRLVDLESNRRAEASVWEDEHKESAKNAQLLAESQQTIQLLRQELQKVAIEHQHALETNEIKYLQAKERFDNEVADELQRTIEEAERRERDATRKIEELAKALQEREAFISHISEQLDKAKEGAQRKESEVLQLRFQLEDSKRKVHVKELELQKMNTDLEAIRRESERIQLDLSEAQMEKNYHTSKLGERNSLLLMIARTLSETINDRDILEENSTENFGYVRDFVITNLKTLTKIRADVQAKFSKRENLLASVQSSWYAAFEEINGRLRSAESVVQNLHEGGREWADEKRSLLGQLETEKNAHERVRTQLANAEAELVDARNRTSNLTKDLERARTQLASTGVERDLAIQKSSESLKFELESLQELLRNSEQRLEHERRGAMSRVQELQQANR
ncbi:hypothetical protein BJ742DRAFT_365235 [Cladochytrium replicatum]|nr:hypothetical protein BJ742DRAFT_365235 [Cladochytrium replicatum]